MDQDFLSQTALDQMVTSDQTQMLKAAIPYLPPSGQQILSVYAKIQELANTLSLFSPVRQEMQVCAAETTDPLDMIQDIRKHSFGGSRRQLDQIANILALVQMIQIMNE
ncbi:MAG TPA: hypothetical protein IAA05_14145 [Candidatus Blautia excrementipullorum]|nr:hypothetical protein [Candidatus Blautia excrementipullorum]